MSLEHLGLGVSIFTSDIHKFTTDTVILAHFISDISNLNVIDLCSGCGALSLLLSRNCRPAHITAIEIQKDACDLFLKSVSFNKFADFISVVNCNLKDFHRPDLYNSFDAIICNPPYKPLKSGILSGSHAKNLIKHEIACNIDDISLFAKNYLKDKGELFLCARSERLPEIIRSTSKYNLEAKVLRFAHYKYDTDSKFFCMEVQKNAKSFLKVLSPLIMNDKNPEFHKIYQPIKNTERP